MGTETKTTTARPCEFARLVDAYHDGELAPVRRAALERHLDTCAACAAELRAVGAVSARLKEASLAPIPGSVLDRLHQDARNGGRAREERMVLRIAEVLTGAAAAVFLAGLIGLQHAAVSRAAPRAEWEEAAVLLDDPAALRDDPTRLVAWAEDDEPAP